MVLDTSIADSKIKLRDELNKLEKEKYHTDFPLMDMMQEFQMILKFLQT